MLFIVYGAIYQCFWHIIIISIVIISFLVKCQQCRRFCLEFMSGLCELGLHRGLKPCCDTDFVSDFLGKEWVSKAKVQLS